MSDEFFGFDSMDFDRWTCDICDSKLKLKGHNKQGERVWVCTNKSCERSSNHALTELEK